MQRAYENPILVTNLTLAPRPVTLLCSYDASSVPRDLAQVVRRTHPQFIEGGEALESDVYEDPARFVIGDE